MHVLRRVERERDGGSLCELVVEDIEEEEQQVYTLLTTLTVRNCKASRAEDKVRTSAKVCKTGGNASPYTI